jgi:small subunit ribosomal protein S20
VANTRSAEKNIRVAERRRLRNRAVKSATRTFVRKAEQGIVAAAEDAQVLVTRAVSALDKAATKGIIHRNNASRGKARLMKRLNALTATSASTETEEQAAPKRSRATARPKAASGTARKTAARPKTASTTGRASSARKPRASTGGQGTSKS